MNKAVKLSFLILLFCAIAASPAIADSLNLGISVGDRGVEGFYFSLGDYYSVPQREVVVVRERGIPDDELPVAFFIARRAAVPVQEVVAMRLRGMPWMAVSLHYGVGPEVYYVPVRGSIAPPYGHAYGHFNRPRKDWRKIRLNDRDMVTLVNLRFLSEHHRQRPEEIMRMHAEGRHYADIDRHYGGGGWGRDRGRDRDYHRDDRGPGRSDDRGPDRHNDHDASRGRGHGR